MFSQITFGMKAINQLIEKIGVIYLIDVTLCYIIRVPKVPFRFFNKLKYKIRNMLMRAYNFNKNKITSSFMLVYFILRLKKYIYNVSLEIHFYLMMLDGFLAKYCIYSF